MKQKKRLGEITPTVDHMDSKLILKRQSCPKGCSARNILQCCRLEVRYLNVVSMAGLTNLGHDDIT